MGQTCGHALTQFVHYCQIELGIRSFSAHGKKEAHPTEMQAQLGHSDIRTTLDIYTQISDPEVARMVNQVTNRILGWGEEGESGSVR